MRCFGLRESIARACIACAACVDDMLIQAPSNHKANMFLNGDAITISMEQAELIAITSLRIISIKQTYEWLPERKIRGLIYIKYLRRIDTITQITPHITTTLQSKSQTCGCLT